MIRNFISIEEMQLFYANMLSELAQNAKNVNDEVLKMMVADIIADYQNNKELLDLQLKFEKKEYKMRKRQELKDIMQQARFDLQKLRFKHYQRFKSNRKLLKLFKNQFKTSLDKAIVEEEIKLKEMKNYVSSLRENKLLLNAPTKDSPIDKAPAIQDTSIENLSCAQSDLKNET